jgi:uridine phosphorylase
VPEATIHLSPAADLAERVLLPGDPHRALAMAQALLESPRMFNARRGLWGYTGTAPDGEPVTIQSTGMGGPSAAIVVRELVELGASTFVRTGTCGAFGGRLRIGDVIAVDAALADGASRGLGARDSVAADPDLTASLVDAVGRPAVTVASTELFYDPREEAAMERWLAAGAVAVEMEAAAVLQTAVNEGVRAGCVLLVTDLLTEGRRRMPHAEIEERSNAAGVLALQALGS